MDFVWNIEGCNWWQLTSHALNYNLPYYEIHPLVVSECTFYLVYYILKTYTFHAHTYVEMIQFNYIWNVFFIALKVWKEAFEAQLVNFLF